jgi:prepilin-type N-terminal cleavage/methylation domain-containing protein
MKIAAKKSRLAGPRCCAATGAALRRSNSPLRISRNGFTLMEVMIAIGVFCLGVLAILGLVANVLHGARLLDKPMVDAGVVAGQISQTNSLTEVSGVTGDLGEFLGDPYKNYTYLYDITEAQSNKLFEVDIDVLNSDAPGKPLVSKVSLLLYRPQSPPGSLDPGGK